MSSHKNHISIWWGGDAKPVAASTITDESSADFACAVLELFKKEILEPAAVAPAPLPHLKDGEAE